MLKSTHKSPASSQILLPGWTEHKAPSGHPYYYNAATKVSTYLRPQPQPEQKPYQSSHGGALSQQSLIFGTRSDFCPSALNGVADNDYRRGSSQSRSYNGSFKSRREFDRDRDQDRRSQPKDRPKTKHEIPGCEPWLLIKTKLGRRFVHNPESVESHWKFPPDVTKGVVEYDRHEREKRQKTEHNQLKGGENKNMAAAEAELIAAEECAPRVAPRPVLAPPEIAGETSNSDGEYEEFEVTDDEGEYIDANGDGPAQNQERDQPVEFNEDDIAHQLEAMGQEYGLDPDEYGDGYEGELEEGADGLVLTEQDSKALFMDMLDDFHISPYTTWEALIEAGHIIEDDRYILLSNMRTRKEAWSEWGRDKVQRLKEQREKEEKRDPKIPYFAFLEAHATPKLYWPEFRRKYQKEPEMRNTKLNDKDREKWYREYTNRLNLPESSVRIDLVQLLKTLPLRCINRSTTLKDLPAALLTDIRFIAVRKPIRNALVEAHIASLLPAPDHIDLSLEQEQVFLRDKQERERREQALADRHQQVQEEKRKQQGALRQGKGMLRDGEQELERAKDIGREGLLGHMEADMNS